MHLYPAGGNIPHKNIVSFPIVIKRHWNINDDFFSFTDAILFYNFFIYFSHKFCIIKVVAIQGVDVNEYMHGLIK